MTALLITPTAENDLVNIWLNIARDNPEAADRVYKAAEETFHTLAATPGIGTLYRSKRGLLKDVRFFPISNFKRHVVYYREHPEGIEIIRVLHAHMDKRRHLRPR